MHHRLPVRLAAASRTAFRFIIFFFLLFFASDLPPARAGEAETRLDEARAAVKRLFHDRSETGLRLFTPAAAIERLETAGFFGGDKGNEIRKEALLLARKLAFEKRPDLSPGAFLAAAIDSGESEPNDTISTADPIACDSTVTAAIGAPGDVDWFSFSIDTQRLVDLTIDCAGDSTMTLWSSVAVPIEFDDDDGPGLCSKIARVMAPGSYSIEIRDFGGDSVFPYSLSITCTAPPEAEVEPNGTLATAQPFGCGRSVNASISPAGDADWYRLTLDSTYRLIAATDCNGDSTMALRDGAGALIEFDDDDGIGFCSRIERTLAAGDYAIEVREFGDNGTLTYRLRLVCVPLGGDETEPNDSIASADPLACGESLAAHVDPPGDIDFWRIELPEPADVTIGVDCGGADSLLAVFDAGGLLVASSDGSGGALCSRLDLHLGAGTYFAAVQDAAASAPFSYSIGLGCLPPVDETEPNGSLATADPAECGTPLAARIHPAGDADFFTFPIGTQSDVTLDVACDGDANLTLRDAQGAQIAFDDDSGPGFCPRIALRLDPGTYFAEVRPASPAATIEYTLSLACTPPFPPETEPNDDIASADALPCDEVRQGTILPIGDADFWKLTLAVRAVVTADVDCLGRDGTLSLLDSSGALVEFDDDDGAGFCPTITRLLEPGDHYLAVREGGEDAVMPYRIRALCAALPGVDETEPNDDIASADPLPCGAALRGTVERPADADFWAFTLASAARVRLRVAPEVPTLDVAIRLHHAATGRILRAADDSGGPEAAVAMTLGPGAYAVEVRALAGADPFAVYAIEALCDAPEFLAAGCIDDGHARDAMLAAPGVAAEWLYEGVAGETVRIVARSAAFDAHVLLLSPNGDLVDFDDDDADGLDAQIEAVLPLDGTYRVLLQSATAAGFGPCRAALDVVPNATAAELEPNDSPAAAQGIGHGSQVVGFRSTIGDDDWFTFTAAENDVVALEARTTRGADNVPLPPTDVAIELLAADLTPIAFSEDDGEDADPSLTVSLPPSAGGVYFARVTGLTFGAYELFFRFDQFPVTIVPLVPPKVRSGDPVSIRVSGRNVSPVAKSLTFTVDRADGAGGIVRLRTRMARAPVGIVKTVTISVGAAPAVAVPTRFRYVTNVIVGGTSATMDFDVVVEP